MANEQPNLELTPIVGISKKEVVKSFLINLLYYLNSGKDVPEIEFIFPKDSIEYLNSFNVAFFDSNKISTEVKNIDHYNIHIKDVKLFFELLTDIVNEQIKLNYFYGEKYYGNLIVDDILKNIWLRLGSEDFLDVEKFLQKQLEFLKDQTFDKPSADIEFINNQNIDVSYQVYKNPLYFESTRHIQFKIYNDEDYHDLPNILYDICEENGELVCYIFGVQMPTYRHKSKKIEKDLYKLNKGIDECLVHPNFLMAMTLFIELLKENEINHIKVPLLQVLSYPYHTILSNHIKEDFYNRWSNREQLMLESMANSNTEKEKLSYAFILELYKKEKDKFERYADKEDFISKSKTENLINLFTEISCLDNSVQINTTPFIESSYLDINFSKKRNR